MHSLDVLALLTSLPSDISILSLYDIFILLRFFSESIRVITNMIFIKTNHHILLAEI